MVVIVKTLSDLLSQVKDEQSYIVMRERTHRNTAESTNGRVKWWSIFQLGVLIGVGIFQVWWLKRFFEVHLSFHSLELAVALILMWVGIRLNGLYRKIKVRFLWAFFIFEERISICNRGPFLRKKLK